MLGDQPRSVLPWRAAGTGGGAAPEGATPTDGNALVKTYPIAGNSRKDVSELLRQDIEAGWSIIGEASVAGVLTLTMSGPQFITIEDA